MNKRIVSILTLILLLCLIFTNQPECQENNERWHSQRLRLVEILRAEDIKSESVLYSIQVTPRHLFVPEEFRKYSYENRPLPIGLNQTISQPYIVAYMCEALELQRRDRVLEIGTGSGYHAAVMSPLVDTVYSIEILPELAERADRTLRELGYTNIVIKAGDGYLGWQEFAPFDAIILTAAPPKIPQPLIEQLAENGRLIAPVGVNWQELVLIRKLNDQLHRKRLIPVRFVPMTGEAQKTGRVKP